MSSSLHYKLKAGPGVPGSTAWTTLHFDGVYLPCVELKRRIIYSEGWWRTEADATFDLLITNSNSGEEYREDDYSVHRNVSVLVKRIPALSATSARRLFIAPGSLGPDWNKSTSTWVPPGSENSNLTPLGGRASGEDSDIAAMINQRGTFSAPQQRSGPFQQTYSSRTLTPTSRPPSGYVCHRCKQSGHFIQFCPTNGDSNYDHARRSATTREDRERERAQAKEKIMSSSSYGERDYSGRHVGPPGAEGKPSQWLKPVEDPHQKQLDAGGDSQATESTLRQRMFPSQFFAGNMAATVLPNSITPLAPQSSFPPSAPAAAEPAPLSASTSAAMPAPLRADLTCQQCKDYFTDAHVLGCCYTSFCKQCCIDALRPNVNLQKAVDQFLAEHPSIVRGDIRAQRAQAEEDARQARMAPPITETEAPASHAPPPADASNTAYPAPHASNGAASVAPPPQPAQSAPGSHSSSASSDARTVSGAAPARCFTCGQPGHSAKFCTKIGGPGGMPGSAEWKAREAQAASQHSFHAAAAAAAGAGGGRPPWPTHGMQPGPFGHPMAHMQMQRPPQFPGAFPCGFPPPPMMPFMPPMGMGPMGAMGPMPFFPMQQPGQQHFQPHGMQQQQQHMANGRGPPQQFQQPLLQGGPQQQQQQRGPPQQAHQAGAQKRHGDDSSEQQAKKRRPDEDDRN